MSALIFNFFTSAEHENAPALRTTLQQHGLAIKTGCEATEREYKEQLKSLDATYKEHLKNIELEYKQAKKQAKDDMHRKTMSVVQGEIDAVMGSEPYSKAEPKTKTKVELLKKLLCFISETFLGEPASSTSALPDYTTVNMSDVPSVAAVVAARYEEMARADQKETYPDEKATGVLISV
ncbi:hypothetical protein BGZ83_011107 [Gryganskiella cystojenkinii]|nr:hypothetical protein BGZ83_011107 [Gryganskiella cystojenkinii]